MVVEEGEGQIWGGVLWEGWAMSRTEQLEGAGLARVAWLGGEGDVQREAG